MATVVWISRDQYSDGTLDPYVYVWQERPKRRVVPEQAKSRYRVFWGHYEIGRECLLLDECYARFGVYPETEIELIKVG